jgi:short-subunit dehydrogenase involved in D-alanine esterification of teichoic acids
MPFPYKNVLVIGATSGIGWALAERLLENGSKVIVTGRREERLKEFITKNSSSSYFTVDITKLSSLPDFAFKVLRENQNIDCVVLNSGIQRSHDFSKPETVDLNVVEQELTTNYTSYLHLVTAFLPHLQKQSNPTALIFVSSGLGLVPAPRVLNYSATKAALHSFVLCLREQLRIGTGEVRVVEIVPPAVETELHDKRNQPDAKPLPKGVLMPLDQFIKETWEGLESGTETIYVGSTPKGAMGWENGRLAMFQRLVALMK